MARIGTPDDKSPVGGTVYELVGGDAWFFTLVDSFYDRVEHDPVLRPLYPEDLAEPRRHLAQFLAQYWGGPPRYSEERGHPRLRMRHARFKIGSVQRDAWLTHMTAALHEAELAPEVEEAFLDYFTNAADFMINDPG